MNKRKELAKKKHEEWLKKRGLTLNQIKKKRIELKNEISQHSSDNSSIGLSKTITKSRVVQSVEFTNSDKRSFAAATTLRTKNYTGNLLSGYAILHKSNYVPIFNTGSGTKEKAIEIAKMRRS